jgi:SET domain
MDTCLLPDLTVAASARVLTCLAWSDISSLACCCTGSSRACREKTCLVAPAIPGVQHFSAVPASTDEELRLQGCTCIDTCGGSQCACAALNIAAGDPLLQTFECHESCSCSEHCRLKRTSKPTALLYGLLVDGKGWGAFAMCAMMTGQYIGCYAGEMLSTAELQQRRPLYDKLSLNYALSVHEHFGLSVRTTHVDATVRGDMTRLINHSCAPCLELRVVHAGSMQPRLALFAVRAIRAGEELTFSYGTVDATTAAAAAAAAAAVASNTDTAAVRRACLCGEKCCRGLLPFIVD